MNTEELLDSLFSLLEQRCGTIAVTDFTGFLNREQTLGTVLLPYTGHHAPFCAAVSSIRPATPGASGAAGSMRTCAKGPPDPS